MIARALVLVQIALRNLFASPINLVIGGLITVGTMAVVVGGALLDSLDSAMSRSVIGSVAGHLQVYSSESKDELALYGEMGGEADLAALDDFSKVKAVLEGVPNVKSVVPMGINGALVTSGNTVDLTLARLRELYNERQKKAGALPSDLAARIESQKEHVKQIVRVLKSDVEKTQALMAQGAIEARSLEALERAASDVFWEKFEEDPFDALEFLENRIAPLLSDGDIVYLRYVGTDLDAYQKSFDRMRIVDGQMVPPGQRGFLFSKFFYEEFLKLKNARRLDLIKEGLAESGRTLAADPELQRFVKENKSQTREILLQLDALATREATVRLQKALGSSKGSLEELLVELFSTDDANFEKHYRIFYDELAPLLGLYRVRIGDVLTIKAFTRSGYVQSVNVKVYGTFHFEGLEKSPLAGGLNLMDLMSFRDLYGYLTAEKAQELAKLQREAGVQAIARGNVEEELFGGEAQLVAEATPGVIDESAHLTGTARAQRTEDLARRVYSQEEIEGGVVLNAAVILEDPRRLEETLGAIEAAGKAKGLPLKAVSWQKASGILGQFVFVAKAGLYFAVAIIFVVAMVIINNAMMMATLQRTQTIGTMRAIGAQRGFVLTMVLVETLVLGLLFGLLGGALGAGVMALLHAKGIPATSEVMYFFFSGPRLLPVLTAGNLLAAFVIILFVSSVSTLIPAVIATRVSPLRAMQTEE
ncbi:MAG: ABC transporter permease [Myxococcota bacterium]